MSSEPDCAMFIAAAVPGIQYRIEEREIKARMDTPAVRAVLDMGFDRSLVLGTIRRQLRDRGKLPPRDMQCGVVVDLKSSCPSFLLCSTPQTNIDLQFSLRLSTIRSQSSNCHLSCTGGAGNLVIVTCPVLVGLGI